MRRISAVVTALALSSLALVGCTAAGGGDAASCERAEPDSTAFDLIEATGPTDAPQVTLDAPVHVTETVYSDATVGDGTAITSRSQDVKFTAVLANGSTGQTIIAAPAETNLNDFAVNYEGIVKMLDCAREGSRIVGAIPASDLSEQVVQGVALGENDAVVAVIDVDRVYLPAANGAPQYNDGAGLPAVVLAPDGRPGVVIPNAVAPSQLVVQVLKKGTGAPVTAADAVRVHYTGLTWAEKTVFDSSWQKGASATFTLDGVVPGFAQALEGQTVGSQILAIIPPDLGYGDQESASIPAGSTLVFVIDILGVDEATTP
ncbi:FKBP-type peptidyl-prolyl cis-trans isomerase [Microbacterium sp.]|uniref:FKBP-type peptidyl-prolyl cis-trans isomerase n=1 Tax=Microbacterium sp. TaxID=51671 RepID=UPI003A88242D